MKIIGLKPENFERRSVVEKSEPKRSLGLVPIPSLDNNGVDEAPEKKVQQDTTKYVIDFLAKLKAKQKKENDPNKDKYHRAKKAYLTLMHFNLLLSQKGAKLDKKK